MKRFLLLLLLPILATAQEYYIEFNAAERPQDAEYDSIYWRGPDKITQEFILQGSAAKCRLRVIEKGETVLEQAGRWRMVDSLPYIVFPLGGNEYLTPQFQVTDFNQDGREDFVFLPMTNMHGSMSYSIYLQHPDGQLALLKNFAFGYEDENTWPAASYDEATQTISCENPGEVFGVSWEATYRLDGFNAKPLHMHLQQRNTQSWIDEYFTGSDGEWTLIRQMTDVALGLGFDDYDTMDVLHYLIEQEEGSPLRLYSTTEAHSPEDNPATKTLVDTLSINGFLFDLEWDICMMWPPDL
jgi:hypothetical protein